MAEELIEGKALVLQIDLTTSTTAESGTEQNYVTVACEVSHEIEINKNTNAVSNKCSGGWRRTSDGTKEWSAQGEYHAINPDGGSSMVSYAQMQALAASDVEFWLRRGLVDSGSGAFLPVFEGVVKAVNFRATADSENPLSFTVQFEGQGAPILDIVT